MNYGRFFIQQNYNSALSMLRLKISLLYDDRRIKAFKKQLHIPFFKRNRLKNRLADLQKLIYSLDNYFEANWELSNDSIYNMWNNIKQNVIAFGISENTADEILERMKEYMEIELAIRKGEDPSMIEIENFYAHKICDVQLQRDIVLISTHSSISKELLGVWQLYDKVSEIGDDIDDIREDINNFNCNRFVLLSKRIGLENSIKQYSDYINTMQTQLAKFIVDSSHNSDKVEVKQVDVWFQEKSRDCAAKFKEIHLDLDSYKLIKQLSAIPKVTD